MELYGSMSAPRAGGRRDRGYGRLGRDSEAVFPLLSWRSSGNERMRRW